MGILAEVGLRWRISPILGAFASVAVLAAATIYATYSRDISELREQVHRGSQLVQMTMGLIEYTHAGEGFPALVSVSV